MTSIGLCTIHSNVEQLTPELRRIYEEALLVYDKVILINPRNVSYLFVRDNFKPIIRYSDEDISDLSTLLVRSTKGNEAPIAVLVRALRACGCDILDPVDRFSVGKASKLLTTIRRFENGNGSSTYISFSRNGSRDLLLMLSQQQKLPLIIKPVSGSKGQGIKLVETYESGLSYIDSHFGVQGDSDDPFFFQDFVDFKREYRILILDGKVLGMVEKIKLKNTIVSNAAQGALFKIAEDAQIASEVLENVSKEGLIGVDVAVDQQEQIHIIETNRAPQWQAFEEATGINVAKIIIRRAKERIADRGPLH